MYGLDNTETNYWLGNLLLHELVFLGYHSQFTSYPYSFTSYSYSCKILQPYVGATVRVHSGTVIPSIGASRMKKFIKN